MSTREAPGPDSSWEISGSGASRGFRLCRKRLRPAHDRGARRPPGPLRGLGVSVVVLNRRRRRADYSALVRTEKAYIFELEYRVTTRKFLRRYQQRAFTLPSGVEDQRLDSSSGFRKSP